MRKAFFVVILSLFVFCDIVCAQEISLSPRSSSAPSVSVQQSKDDAEIVPTPNPWIVLSGRNVYINQNPQQHVNDRETFQNGEEVPLPNLDRPVTEAWDDFRYPYACQAILNSPYYFQQMNFDDLFTLDVTYVNTGTQPWDFNIDVMQYSGDQLEKDGIYIYDIDKDWKKEHDGNRRIIYPGESIRFTIEMRAPHSPYHEDNKYYSVYTLVKNWQDAYKDADHTPWDALHDMNWGEAHMTGDRYWDENWPDNGLPYSVYEEMYRKDSVGMFCPVYFYIYVPDDNYHEE